MTVKEIFDLRKQGKSEEAYRLIIPMYKEHQGHYTTICMFWCASDVLRIRLDEAGKATDEDVRDEKANEAYAIFLSMQRLYPTMDDKEGMGAQQLYHHAYRLHKEQPAFSMLLFLSSFGLSSLADDDWKVRMMNDNMMPSYASILISAAFADFEKEPTRENADRLLPLVQEALRKQPSYQRYRTMETACKSLL